jgi:hypothetical protein
MCIHCWLLPQINQGGLRKVSYGGLLIWIQAHDVNTGESKDHSQDEIGEVEETVR